VCLVPWWLGFPFVFGNSFIFFFLWRGAPVGILFSPLPNNSGGRFFFFPLFGLFFLFLSPENVPIFFIFFASFFVLFYFFVGCWGFFCFFSFFPFPFGLFSKTQITLTPPTPHHPPPSPNPSAPAGVGPGCKSGYFLVLRPMGVSFGGFFGFQHTPPTPHPPFILSYTWTFLARFFVFYTPPGQVFCRFCFFAHVCPWGFCLGVLLLSLVSACPPTPPARKGGPERAPLFFFVGWCGV